MCQGSCRPSRSGRSIRRRQWCSTPLLCKTSASSCFSMGEEVGGESDPYGIGMSELQCSFSLLKQSLRTQNNGHCPSLPPPVMLMSRHMPLSSTWLLTCSSSRFDVLATHSMISKHEKAFRNEHDRVCIARHMSFPSIAQ